MSIADRPVYATQAAPLRKQVEKLLREADAPPIPGDVLAVIVPDSNKLDGGEIAAEVFKRLDGQEFETVVVVSPSHTGPFRRMNICSLNTYRTPFGELKINDRVRNELCDEDDDIFLDDEGHFHVEGVEVQLPFLQTMLGDFDVVPIVMGDESPEFCRELGTATGEVMYNRPTLLVATADVLEATEDAMAEFKRLFEGADVSRLMALLNSEKVRIEGKGAVLVALLAALHRRADHVEVVRMQPPRDGDRGYVGAILWRG